MRIASSRAVPPTFAVTVVDWAGTGTGSVCGSRKTGLGAMPCSPARTLSVRPRGRASVPSEALQLVAPEPPGPRFAIGRMRAAGWPAGSVRVTVEPASACRYAPPDQLAEPVQAEGGGTVDTGPVVVPLSA